MRPVLTLLALSLVAAGCGSPPPAPGPAPRTEETAPADPPGSSSAGAEASRGPSVPEAESGTDGSDAASEAGGQAARDASTAEDSSEASGASGTDAGPAPDASLLPRRAPDRWWHLETLEGGVPSTDLDGAHALLAGRAPAREVVVAVIDGGVDVQHEDLDDVLWVNGDEVPGNGLDDDRNGYVDDVHGWNFIGGADGRHVHHDTYEMTRLHAACVGGAAAGGTPRPGPDLCAEVAAAYEAEREELTGLARQIEQIQQIYPILVGILGAAVGAEPTLENVGELVPADPRTAEARSIFLQLAAAGIDEELLAEEAEQVGNRLRYGLDTDFDPRPVVGDDYGDPTERYYGNGDVEGPDPSHGTAVASVVAAERDNGVGIDGAAGAGVRLMIVRAVPEGDERDKDVANAIRYAVDNGADVVNMSFGKDFSPYREVVEEAIRYADARGVLMVHASGNDGADLRGSRNFPSPAYADGSSPALWIEVGASAWQTPDSLAASFSNYGAGQVDVFAPGVAIRAAAPDDDYEPSDGTSVAAPVVSGIAGLLLAYFSDLDAAGARRLILETATDMSRQDVARPGGEEGIVPFGELSSTGGVVNAAAAVRRALAEEEARRGGAEPTTARPGTNRPGAAAPR